MTDQTRNSSDPRAAARLSVAPMMDWTDRHCRYFHRQLSRHVLLYTEMVTAAAVIHGPRDRLLGFDPSEHPVALQLGGADPAQLSRSVPASAGTVTPAVCHLRRPAGSLP
jgi:tRNA-dihydrouridine synthase A